MTGRLKKLADAGLLSTSADPTHKQKTICNLTEPAFMDELRSLHPGAKSPQHSVIRELTDACLAVAR